LTGASAGVGAFAGTTFSFASFFVVSFTTGGSGDFAFVVPFDFGVSGLVFSAGGGGGFSQLSSDWAVGGLVISGFAALSAGSFASVFSGAFSSTFCFSSSLVFGAAGSSSDFASGFSSALGVSASGAFAGSSVLDFLASVSDPLSVASDALPSGSASGSLSDSFSTISSSSSPSSAYVFAVDWRRGRPPARPLSSSA